MRKAILHLKQADPVMAAIIEAAGPYRIEYQEPVFETLARSIIFQQLSGRVATVIFDRVAAAAGCEGALTPEAILALTPEGMRACGLSGQKTRYLRDLAERTLSGDVKFDELPLMSDAEVTAHLTQVRGVGVWTSHMFLMFALRRHDVLPVGDLGIRMAMKRAYRMRQLPKPERMEKLAKQWRPWCSVACWYLWRSLEIKPEIKP
jgi:DNA-3-methyladenine glycosylase II